MSLFGVALQSSKQKLISGKTFAVPLVKVRLERRLLRGCLQRIGTSQRLNMARTLAILVGIVGTLYWVGLIDYDEEHLKWFCLPFGAYLIGMAILFD
jgi:hypothetical protein